MPHGGYADPITNDGTGFHSDMPISELTKHVTRAIEVTLPTTTLLSQCMSIHSSILIHPSIAYAIVASQCFVSRQEEVVVSFDMSGDHLRFKGWPAEGSRPPRVK